MQTVRKLRKRSGFTLVELLIVIIIIGILAGAMLLVAGSGTDSAEATKVISTLRSMKAGALMYYADNPNADTVPSTLSLDQYMDGKISDNTDYDTDGTASTGWFMRYDLSKGSTGVVDRLKKAEGIIIASGDTHAMMKAR